MRLWLVLAVLLGLIASDVAADDHGTTEGSSTPILGELGATSALDLLDASMGDAVGSAEFEATPTGLNTSLNASLDSSSGGSLTGLLGTGGLHSALGVQADVTVDTPSILRLDAAVAMQGPLPVSLDVSTAPIGPGSPAGATSGEAPQEPGAGQGASGTSPPSDGREAGDKDAQSIPPVRLALSLAPLAAAATASTWMWRPEWLLRPLLRVGRWLAAIPILGLFSRLRDDELLQHPLRAQAMQYLEANPGSTMQEVQEALAVAWGTTVYHLERMEKARHVVSHRDGKTRRFWIEADAQARHRSAASLLKVATPRQLAMAVRQNPGLHQRALAAELDILPATACKYLRKMEGEGLVTVQTQDRKRLYYPTSRLDQMAMAS